MIPTFKWEFPSRVLFRGANKPGRFPGKRAQVWSFFVRRHRGRRRKEKKVGRIGLRGNYYDADFFAFRTRIGSLKKNATVA